MIKSFSKAIMLSMFFLLSNAAISFAQISMNAAKNTALSSAGITDAVMLKQEQDHSDRYGMVYEFKFIAGKYLYEVEVSQTTGEVVKFEKEMR